MLVQIDHLLLAKLFEPLSGHLEEQSRGHVNNFRLALFLLLFWPATAVQFASNWNAEGIWWKYVYAASCVVCSAYMISLALWCEGVSQKNKKNPFKSDSQWIVARLGFGAMFLYFLAEGSMPLLCMGIAFLWLFLYFVSCDPLPPKKQMFSGNKQVVPT